jgi:rRNA maturation endonuclease Nob1
MNDIERAIESIKNQNEFIGIDYSKGKDLTVICLSGNLAEDTIQALEKQIPKKVKEYSLNRMSRNSECPNCDKILPYVVWHEELEYCPNCGQALQYDDPVADKLQELLDRENERFKG